MLPRGNDQQEVRNHNSPDAHFFWKKVMQIHNKEDVVKIKPLIQPTKHKPRTEGRSVREKVDSVYDPENGRLLNGNYREQQKRRLMGEVTNGIS